MKAHVVVLKLGLATHRGESDAKWKIAEGLPGPGTGANPGRPFGHVQRGEKTDYQDCRSRSSP